MNKKTIFTIANLCLISTAIVFFTQKDSNRNGSPAKKAEEELSKTDRQENKVSKEKLKPPLESSKKTTNEAVAKYKIAYSNMTQSLIIP